MKCANCGNETTYRTKPQAPSNALVLEWDLDHSEYEKWAWYCETDKKVFCGTCAFPKWQALKRKEGLSGPALARKLNADPDAVFTEYATCPTCKSMLNDEGPKGACFIATAACGAADAPDVEVLRRFRDRHLLHRPMGRRLIATYERLSPPMADFIAKRPSLRWTVRWTIVRPLALLAGGR